MAKVLIADPDAGRRELLATVLRRQGFVVTAVGDHGAGAAALAAGPYALVVTAEDTPGAGTSVLCARVKKQAPATRVALLGASGDAAAPTDGDAGEAGDALLGHPLQLAELTALVGRWQLREGAAVELPSPRKPKSVPRPAPPARLRPMTMQILVPAPDPAAAARLDLPRLPRPLTIGVAGAAAHTPEIELDDLVVGGDAPAAVQGDLAQVGLAQLLGDMGRISFTGILHLTRAGVRRRIHVADGVPYRVDSDQLAESLERTLVEHGRLTNAELENAQQIARKSKLRTWKVLVGQGRLSEPELVEALQVQTETRLVNSFAWTDGEYVVEATEGPDDGLRAPVALVPAVWRGVLEHYREEAVREWFDIEAGKYVVPQAALAAHLHSLAAHLEAAGVLARLDGTARVDALLGPPGGDGEARGRMLYALLVLGLVSLEANASASPGLPEAEPAALELEDVAAAEDAVIDLTEDLDGTAPAADAALGLYNEGLALLEHSAATARQRFEAAVAAAPAEPAYRVALAAAILGESPSDGEAQQRAKVCLEQALHLDPANVEASVHLANLSLQLGESARAEDLLTRVLQRVPDEPRAVHLLGLIAQAEPAAPAPAAPPAAPAGKPADRRIPQQLFARCRGPEGAEFFGCSIEVGRRSLLLTAATLPPVGANLVLEARVPPSGSQSLRCVVRAAGPASGAELGAHDRFLVEVVDATITWDKFVAGLGL